MCTEPSEGNCIPRESAMDPCGFRTTGSLGSRCAAWVRAVGEDCSPFISYSDLARAVVQWLKKTEAGSGWVQRSVLSVCAWMSGERISRL